MQCNTPNPHAGQMYVCMHIIPTGKKEKKAKKKKKEKKKNASLSERGAHPLVQLPRVAPLISLHQH